VAFEAGVQIAGCVTRGAEEFFESGEVFPGFRGCGFPHGGSNCGRLCFETSSEHETVQVFFEVRSIGAWWTVSKVCLLGKPNSTPKADLAAGFR